MIHTSSSHYQACLSILCTIAALLLNAGCASMDQDLSALLAELDLPHIPVQTQPLDEPLILDQAIERAIASSDTIAALHATVDVARQQKSAAADLGDPELRLTFQEGTAEDEFTDWVEGPIPGTGSLVAGTRTEDAQRYRIGVRLPLPHPLRRSGLISTANANVYAAIADLHAAQWLLAVEVRRLFAEFNYLEKDVAAVDDLVKVNQTLVNITKQRAEQGQATTQDLMTASRRYLRALSEKDITSRRYDEVRRILADLTAVSAENLEISTDEEDFSSEHFQAMSIESLEKNALIHRADLSALFWRAAAAKAACREAKANRMPWPEYLQVSYSSTSQGQPDDESLGVDWRVDTSVNIPLFAWFNNMPDVRMAEYRHAKIMEAEAIKRLGRDVGAALDAVKYMEKSHNEYQTRAAPVIEEMQAVITANEQLSGLSPDEIARIQSEMLESKRLRLRSAFEYRLAVTRLEEVIGRELTNSQ
jgi:outer membrane protein TolC